MKLTAQQITFINTYLKNSGVEYIDIRYEMADHIATALEGMEGDFNENFRKYMLLHKKDILASGKKFSRIAVKRALRVLAMKLRRPKYIALLTLIFLAELAACKAFSLTATLNVLKDIYGLLVIFMALHYVYSYFSSKEKYSVADKLLWIFAAGAYWVLIAFKPESFITGITALLIFYALVSGLFLMAYITYWQLKRSYKLQYQ